MRQLVHLAGRIGLNHQHQPNPAASVEGRGEQGAPRRRGRVKFSVRLKKDVMNSKAARTYALDKLKHGLSPTLTYHGLPHTLDVHAAVLAYAQTESVEGEELELLVTAALFHDIGFLHVYRGHEARGCEVAREALPGFDYSEAQIDRICGMIMATRLPQSPNNRLEEILCDCDLDYLGREDFYSIGARLFEEFKTYGIVRTEEEWNRLQVGFLKAHRYFTETANQLRQPRKLQHLHEVEQIVAAYSAGS